jgi:DNA-binding transcriptional LysR family regulator
MINLWQLRVFLEVSETGSFSAAAGRLHLTQPGVSQQVRALETHLGTQLFVRRGHGVELTPAGYELLDPARRMLNLSELTERTLTARRGEVSGRIRLGCSLSSAPFMANPWLLEFRARHPEVTLQIEYVEPGPLIGALRAQELDGGFVLGRMRGRGLVHHRIMEDPITLIVPLNHPWTSPAELGRAQLESDPPLGQANGTASEAPLPKARDGHERNDLAESRRGPRHEEEGWIPAVKPAMLKDEPMVLEHGIGESHSDARRALNDALEERGLSTRDLRTVLEVPGPASVACAVAEGLGVGLVPQSIARRFVGQVVPVRIEGFALVQHVYLIRDRKALNSPAVSAWWSYIEEKAKPRQHEPGEVASLQSKIQTESKVQSPRTKVAS